MAEKLRAVILDGNTENPGDLDWNDLAEAFDLTVYPRTPPELVLERAKNADVIILNKVVLTRELIEKLPKLKFVAELATGFNQIDVAALKERRIPVSNIPAYSTDAVAQMVFAYLLNYTNRVESYTESVKQMDWCRCEDFCYWKQPLYELGGKTLGIIGFGRIGAAVARIAYSFGMKVLAYTPSGKKDGVSDVTFTSLNSVLAEADFVTLHCPLNDATNKMANNEFLGKMKAGAGLINAARGGVVDEQAVADALKNGNLAFYATDVLSTEPPKKDNPLLYAPNCYITPHVAWAAVETRKRLMSILNANVKAFLEGHPQNVVNP